MSEDNVSVKQVEICAQCSHFVFFIFLGLFQRGEVIGMRGTSENRSTELPASPPPPSPATQLYMQLHFFFYL